MEGGSTPDMRDPALPPIGAIDRLEPGIYSVVLAPPGQSRVDLLSVALTDPAMTRSFSETCGSHLRVIHPDGLIATGSFDRHSPPSSTQFLSCEQAGPMVYCACFSQPLADNPGTRITASPQHLSRALRGSLPWTRATATG